MWTAAAAAGSKVQTLAALSLGGRMGELEGLALLVLATSVAILAASVADIGMSTQVVRAYASGGVRRRGDMLPGFLTRMLICLPLAFGAAVLLAVIRADITDAVLWVGMIVFYALAFLSSMVITGMAYGLGRFRGGASLNGVVRAATIPLLFLVSLTGASPLALLAVLGAGEVVIAVVQYRIAPRDNPRPVGPAIGMRIRDSWKLGVGSIMNTFMNRSDTVIISGVTSGRALGIYGIASQIENALSTTAMIPAGAATTYAAQSRDRARAVAHRRTVSGVVALAYLVLATPFFFFAEPLTELVLGVQIDDVLPIQVLVVSGLFASLGAVAMKILNGEGRLNAVAGIWVVTAIVTTVAMAGGAYWGGALGAAVGAACRDVLFFGLTWFAVISGHRRDEVEVSVTPVPESS